MNESKKTFAFVGMAAVMAVLAVSSHFMNQPTNSADFELIGQPFFPEFDSASQAKSLEVAAVDPETARLQRFSVQNKDGLWRIPSHYDYPAEAAARLATTASSVMGIERESLAGRIKKEHERLGVIDPLSDEIEDPESVGKRISLKDADGEVVVDYIVGKVAGDVVLSNTDQPFGTDGNEKYYYVRRPDEQQTYKVKLDIDLSTKFSDWIDPDLLRVSRSDLTRIDIDNYTLEEDRSNPLAQTKALFKAQGDKLAISRKSNTDPWELADLDPEKEELVTARIDQMLSVFDEMKIAGVRPKYKYKDHLLLTADLKLNAQPEFEKNPQEFGRAISRLQQELEQKGFSLAGSAKEMALVAQNGDLAIGTEHGVLYTLHIGRAVEGDEQEIEIGLDNSTDEKKSDSTGAAESPNGNGDGDDNPETVGDESTDTEADADSKTDADADSKTDADARNRYLMVRVSFDESLLGPKPEAPVESLKPVVPEGYEPAPPEEKKTDDAPAKPDGNDDSEAETESSDQDDEPEAPPEEERNPEFVKYDEATKAFNEQKLEYELATTRFEDQKKEFEEKVEKGKLLVKELNERFGDWYYVISADNLKTLQTERTDLVSLKAPPEGETPEPPIPSRPNISFPDLPGAEGGIKPSDESADQDSEAADGPKTEPEVSSEPAETPTTDAAKDGDSDQ